MYQLAKTIIYHIKSLKRKVLEALTLKSKNDINKISFNSVFSKMKYVNPVSLNGFLFSQFSFRISSSKVECFEFYYFLISSITKKEFVYSWQIILYGLK